MTQELGGITEAFVPVPGGNVYVKTWRPQSARNKTPLILLHDSLGCVDTWRDFPLQLCQRTGRVIVAYDRLGFGRSSARNEPPSLRFINEEAEIYLPALLQALACERFALFGHSVGGAMAVLGAAHMGKACEAVITESAQAFVEERTRSGIIVAQREFADPTDFAKLEKYHGAKARWVLDAWVNVWLSKKFAGWSLAHDLPRMRCPALVLHGDNDEYGSVQCPKTISQLAGGGAEMQIARDCGHVPHRESPEWVLTLVANFLSRLGPEARR